MVEKRYDAVVIGAGIGGLTAAAILSKNKIKTLVLENAPRVGGCCSTYEKEGYRFDYGAVYLMNVEQTAFKMVMDSVGITKSGLNLIECNPLYTHKWNETKELVVHRDITRYLGEIEKLFPQEKENVKRFIRDAKKVMDIAMDYLMKGEKNKLINLLNWKHSKMILKRGEWILDHYFKTDSLKWSYGYYSWLIGMPPHRGSGTLVMTPILDFNEGIYYPKGGMVQLPLAIKNIVEKNRGKVACNAKVKNILVEDSRVKGVELANGEIVDANIIVSNANTKDTYLKLIGKKHLSSKFYKKIEELKYSCSAITFSYTFDERPPLKAYNNEIGLTMEESRKAGENIIKGRLPEKGPILLCCPTLLDSSIAPNHKHIINVAAPMPFRNDWEKIKDKCLERVISQIKNCYPWFPKKGKLKAVITPQDYANEILLPNGSIFGLDHSLHQMGPFRPANKSPIEGLYVCGHSSKPSGGLQFAALSGYNTANLIIEELNKKKRIYKNG
jgi:phytoene desaturase